LYVAAKDASGNRSATTSVIVVCLAPDVPVVNAVRYTSTTVTGKTERYAVITVKIGTRTYNAKSNYYGNFKVSIPKQKKGN
jgi:Bacterial Ig domain